MQRKFSVLVDETMLQTKRQAELDELESALAETQLVIERRRKFNTIKLNVASIDVIGDTPEWRLSAEDAEMVARERNDHLLPSEDEET